MKNSLEKFIFLAIMALVFIIPAWALYVLATNFEVYIPYIGIIFTLALVGYLFKAFNVKNQLVKSSVSLGIIFGAIYFKFVPLVTDGILGWILTPIFTIIAGMMILYILSFGFAIISGIYNKVVELFSKKDKVAVSDKPRTFERPGQ